MLELATAWLVTFAVHSTALLGVLWLGRRGLRRLPDAAAELLIRFSLLAPLLTASVQVAAVPEPAAGHLTRVPGGVSPPPQATTRNPEPLGMATAPAAPESPASPAPGMPAAVTPVPDPAASAPRQTPASAGTGPELLMPWLTLAAAVAAGCGLLWGLRLRVDLWRLLRRRRSVDGGPLVEELDRLRRRAGLRRRVRLSACSSLRTPIAFGVRRPEICVPERVLAELPAPERAGMLAHELAHIARRDPLWLCVGEVLQYLFCWQPLLRFARRHLRELAEYRADTWAARLTGGLPLARCLLVVADWVARSPRSVRLLPGMAQQGSALKGRIDRLLGEARPVRLGRHALWIAPLCAAVLVAMTSALPGAQWRRAPDPIPGPGQQATPPGPALPVLLEDLARERQGLRAEVAALHRELPPDLDPQLADLLEELYLRLESLDRRARDLARLLAAPGEELPPPRRDR